MINGSMVLTPKRLHRSPVPSTIPYGTGHCTIFEAPSSQFPFRGISSRERKHIVLQSGVGTTGTLYPPHFPYDS